MKKEISELCKNLEIEIVKTYTEPINAESAERLAARFLHAQLQLIDESSALQLDARMRKAGHKTIRAGVYLNESTKYEKKPTEAAIASAIDINPEVQESQAGLDQAEVDSSRVEGYLNVFKDAHILYRKLCKGEF